MYMCAHIPSKSVIADANDKMNTDLSQRATKGDEAGIKYLCKPKCARIRRTRPKPHRSL